MFDFFGSTVDYYQNGTPTTEYSILNDICGRYCGSRTPTVLLDALLE